LVEAVSSAPSSKIVPKTRCEPRACGCSPAVTCARGGRGGGDPECGECGELDREGDREGGRGEAAEGETERESAAAYLPLHAAYRGS